MAKHTVSKADQIFYGPGVSPGTSSSYPGAPLTPPRVKLSLGSPVAIDDDGYRADAAIAAAGALTLDGALVSNGVGTPDVPRNVVITSAGDDSGITFTITGTRYQDIVVETVTGADTGAAASAKAFDTVTAITASGAAAGNVKIGTGDVLGLPFAATTASQIPAVWFNDALDASATVVNADTTDPATATTGDTRGTVDPDSACDGSAVEVEMYPDGTSAEGLHGIAQYGG